MKVLFFGLGSIGQRYYNLLADNFNYDIFAYRSLNCVLPEKQNLWDWDSIDSIKPDVAIITNPTHMHIATAIQCAERGMHLFITKPIDCRNDYLLTHLKNLVETGGLTCYIAYPLRHLPIVQELKSERLNHSVLRFVCHTNLSKWRNYKTYSAKYSQGGGALLELSHELDMAAYLLGDVLKIRGSVFNLKGETDAEDVANVTLFHKGANTSFHSLSLVADVEERYVLVDGRWYDIVPDNVIYLDTLKYFFDNIGNVDINNNLTEASRLYELLWEFRDATHNNDMRQGWK